MAVVSIFPNNESYECLNADIVNNKVTGLQTSDAVGKKVYVKDLSKTYTINPDYTLTLYSEGVSVLIGGSTISNTNQLATEVPCYMARGQVTRSTTVTAYTSGQVILANASTVLPEIDLSTSLGVSMVNRKIAITSAYIISDNGANPAFSGYVDIFSVNNPTVSVSLTDYALFAPTAAGLVAGFSNTIDDISNTRKYSTVSNLSWMMDITRKVQCDANGKIYFAPVCTSSYTPKANEVISLLIKFYLLN